MNLATKSSLLAIALVALLAACGGGGGGGGTSPGGNGVIPATTSPTPTPMSGGAGSAIAAGTVYDLDNGQPLGGATVVIGNSIIAGGTPPATLPGDDKSAVTAANGTYTITGLDPGTRSYGCGNTTSGADGYCQNASPQPNVAFVHVFTSNMVTLHGYTTIVSGMNAVQNLSVTAPTALDAQRLTKLNWYRQNAPNPNNVWSPPPVAVAPVVQDEYLTEAARFYANYITTNTPAVEGQDPDQGSTGTNFSPNSRYHSRGGFPVLDDFEDLGAGGGSQSIILLPGTIYANTLNNLPEDAFYLEGPTGLHFQRIMDAQAVWVGFGAGAPGTAGYDAVSDLTHLPQ